MVLTAQHANNFTLNAITIQGDADLQQEVDLTERSIRNATSRQRFDLVYDARIIGNPINDPQNDDNLTAAQIAYRDAFTSVGYMVSRDDDTGLWRLSWADEGIEMSVSLYTMRTTVAPGAISTLTIEAIDEYFGSLTPAVQSRTTLVNVGNGADTDEGDFGGTTSVFYEYVSIVTQQDSSVDYSGGVRTALITSPLGYTDVPSNVIVYKIV